MLYDISTQGKARETLHKVTGLSDEFLSKEWLMNKEKAHVFLAKIKQSVYQWDIQSVEFVVKHVTASCCELKDIYEHGLLYLPDILKYDTFLSQLLKECDFHIDVNSKKLEIAGQKFELEYEKLTHRSRTEPYHEELLGISRCLYKDYLSTFLYCKAPYYYGIGLAKHPEFMEYVKKFGSKGLEIVNIWDSRSKGYIITAKVPFTDVHYETFGFAPDEDERFILDGEKGYKRCKEYLITIACELAFQGFESNRFLFLKHDTRISRENFINIEEKDK